MTANGDISYTLGRGDVGPFKNVYYTPDFLSLFYRYLNFLPKKKSKRLVLEKPQVRFISLMVALRS
jgi:hypothetical protein